MVSQSQSATEAGDAFLMDIESLYETLIGEMDVTTKTGTEILDAYREKIGPESENARLTVKREAISTVHPGS